jgi:hypothetical protein
VRVVLTRERVVLARERLRDELELVVTERTKRRVTLTTPASRSSVGPPAKRRGSEGGGALGRAACGGRRRSPERSVTSRPPLHDLPVPQDQPTAGNSSDVAGRRQDTELWSFSLPAVLITSAACSTPTRLTHPDHHQPDKPALCRGPGPASLPDRPLLVSCCHARSVILCRSLHPLYGLGVTRISIEPSVETVTDVESFKVRSIRSTFSCACRWRYNCDH